MRTRAMIVAAALLALGAASRLEAQNRTPTARDRVEKETRTAVGRGRLGMMYQVSGANETVVVTSVLRDSPAARAGLQVGDTVTLWNGRRDVATAMLERPLQPGDTVRVRVRRGSQRDQALAMVAADRGEPLAILRPRDGDSEIVIRPEALERLMRSATDSLMLHADSLHERIQLLMRDSLGPRLREFERSQMPELQARIRELERVFPRLAGERFVIDLGGRSVAGAEFAEVNQGLASYFGTDDGVLVLKVAPETPAARAGLQAGDVVLRVDDQPVGAIEELRRAVARAQTRDDRNVTLEVLRRGQRRQLEMLWE
jgi:S1-C subfamily serine protease